MRDGDNHPETSLGHAGKQQKQERPFLKKVGGQNQLPKMSSDLYTHHVAQEQTHKHNLKKKDRKTGKRSLGRGSAGAGPGFSHQHGSVGTQENKGSSQLCLNSCPQFLNGRPARGSLTTCVEH